MKHCTGRPGGQRERHGKQYVKAVSQECVCMWKCKCVRLVSWWGLSVDCVCFSLTQMYFQALFLITGFGLERLPCLSTLAFPIGMVKSLDRASSVMSKATPYMSSFSRTTTARPKKKHFRQRVYSMLILHEQQYYGCCLCHTTRVATSTAKAQL